jgi:hypothetical protein
MKLKDIPSQGIDRLSAKEKIMFKQAKNRKDGGVLKGKVSSCAKNFMLSEIMKGHPIYSRYADFYRTIAVQELSAIRIEVKPVIRKSSKW